MSLKKTLALFLAAAVAVALCVGCSRKKADNYIQLSQVKNALSKAWLGQPCGYFAAR